MRGLAAFPALFLFSFTPLWKCTWWSAPPTDAVAPATGSASRDGLGTARDTSKPLTPTIQSAKREESVSRVERPPRLAPKLPPVTIPDRDVVRALGVAEPAFMACFHRAQKRDPTMISAKINLRLYVDESGIVMSAHADVADPKLATCIVRVASNLVFPPPNALAVADMTFFAW